MTCSAYDIRNKGGNVMINMITEVMGSTYWLNEVTATKSVSEKGKVKMDRKDKLSQIAHLQRVKAISELKAKNKDENSFFKTEMTVNEKGERSIVLVTNNKGYREINLDGGKQEKIINPTEVRRAYFNK